ncbi:MAG: hypothetical protein H0U72_11775 [Nitrosospira sp.]|nr:hypothetical protein [Nitrosospira sp.]
MVAAGLVSIAAREVFTAATVMGWDSALGDMDSDWDWAMASAMDLAVMVTVPALLPPPIRPWPPSLRRRRYTCSDKTCRNKTIRSARFSYLPTIGIIAGRRQGITRT